MFYILISKIYRLLPSLCAFLILSFAFSSISLATEEKCFSIDSKTVVGTWVSKDKFSNYVVDFRDNGHAAFGRINGGKTFDLSESENIEFKDGVITGIFKNINTKSIFKFFARSRVNCEAGMATLYISLSFVKGREIEFVNSDSQSKSMKLSTGTFRMNEKKCSIAEAKEAEEIAGVVQDWSAFYNAYTKYAHCDDGAIAEGFSDSVGRMYSNHWRELPSADLIFKDDPLFRNFILDHLDSTVPLTVIERVKKNSRENCPSGLLMLCEDILARIKMIK